MRNRNSFFYRNLKDISGTHNSPIFLVFIVGIFCFFSQASWADKYKFEGKFESKSYVDSTRKDYFALVYTNTSWDPIIVPKTYDKTFTGSIDDLSFTLKGDLSPTQILDFKENCHYQYYFPEDYQAYALDNYKYKYLDHQFNLTYGLSLGKQNAIQLDYFNSIYRIPIDNLGEYQSNVGKARFNHKINRNTSLAFEGDFEERVYPNDESSNYRDGALIVDFSKFFPERIRYRPVGSSSRGNKSTFENTPTGMATQKAVDYYTNWTTAPGSEPQAKYVPQVVFGDLYINLTGDFRKRERWVIDNHYLQSQGTLKATYDADDNLKFSLEDIYYTRRWDTESDYYYLFDHSSNKVSLTATYKPDKKFSHILTGSSEFYKHTVHTEQDYTLNYFTWETYYYYGRNSISSYFKDAWQRYGNPRYYYPDSDQKFAIVSYDYQITKNFYLHLKDDWTRYDYINNEDVFYSSYTRNIWKVAFEKVLDKNNSLELGYQDKKERHKVYYSNDITEKSIYFSWIASI